MFKARKLLLHHLGFPLLQYTPKSIHREERFIWVYGFRGTMGWLVPFGLMQELKHVRERQEWLTSYQQESKVKAEKGREIRETFHTHPWTACFNKARILSPLPPCNAISYDSICNSVH